MTQQKTYITPAMRAYIGTESLPLVSPPIGVSDIRKAAIAMYWPKVPPRLYWDEEYAKKTVWKGIIAPSEFNPFAWMVGRADIGPQPERIDAQQAKIEQSREIRPPGAPERYLFGGMTANYSNVMRPGDVINSVVRLADLYERTGRLGLMLFYVTEERWTNQKKELIKTISSNNILY